MNTSGERNKGAGYLTAVGLVFALAGCGGSAKNFSPSAFRACINSSSTGTVSVTAARGPLQRTFPAAASLPWDGFATYMPHAWIALFPGAQTVVFDLDEKPSLDRARQWLGDDLPQASVRVDGNLLMLPGAHPTAGVLDVINTCESKARLT